MLKTQQSELSPSQSQWERKVSNKDKKEWKNYIVSGRDLNLRLVK